MRSNAVQSHLTHFTKPVFRAHNPLWSFEPESGEGAKRAGGRFNPVGTKALYTSISEAGAWVEAQGGFRVKAQPLTICQYDVNCYGILNLTIQQVLDDCGIKPNDMSCKWEDLESKGLPIPSWDLAIDLIKLGVSGIIVPSYASRANSSMKNLVFWKWNDGINTVKVVDDENRLPRKPYK